MRIAKIIGAGLVLGLFCLTSTSLATRRLVVLEEQTNTS